MTEKEKRAVKGLRAFGRREAPFLATTTATAVVTA